MKKRTEVIRLTIRSNGSSHKHHNVFQNFTKCEGTSDYRSGYQLYFVWLVNLIIGMNGLENLILETYLVDVYLNVVTRRETHSKI